MEITEAKLTLVAEALRSEIGAEPAGPENILKLMHIVEESKLLMGMIRMFGNDMLQDAAIRNASLPLPDKFKYTGLSLDAIVSLSVVIGIKIGERLKSSESLEELLKERV